MNHNTFAQRYLLANSRHSTAGISDSRTYHRHALQKGPYCSAKTITLTLVPWSCLLDATHNVLSCSDSFLLYEEIPGDVLHHACSHVWTVLFITIQPFWTGHVLELAPTMRPYILYAPSYLLPSVNGTTGDLLMHATPCRELRPLGHIRGHASRQAMPTQA